ncbi:hypothetical protein PR202_ga12240 [Eleusine coracana subsp. coracana]|uniref:Uncharacterized protein n=1 Tax=Eleusine coracana subsp. coracana TaxID=191504 RepID=A0AAV5CBA2_ELECO|nr:hypothetical protein PR202_ga12240 [Eleusine coracana subsp. coracana]
MGQALRRASGHVRPPHPPPAPPARPPPPPPLRAPAAAAGGAPQDRLDAPSNGANPAIAVPGNFGQSFTQHTAYKGNKGVISMPIAKTLNFECNADVATPTKNAHDVLEERDPSYEEMLKHMVGRITTKPGGKPEMGEASIVQRYDRPLPKVRTSGSEPGQSGSRQLPQGALNVQHIQEIIQLYQGKSSSHHGPMSVDDIASKFRIEATTVQNIVQFVSLPQDEDVKKKEPE